MQYLDCVEENNNRLRFGVLCNSWSVWKKIITGYGLVCYAIPGVSGTIKKIVTGYALVCYAIAGVSGIFFKPVEKNNNSVTLWCVLQ